MRPTTLPVLVVTLAAVAAACGGSPTPAPATPAASETAATPLPPAPSASGTSSASSETPPPKPTMESQRVPFMAGCVKQTHAQEYCACGFEQFADIFKDTDLSQRPPPEKLELLKTRTVQACGSKLPEPVIKDNFLKGCAGDQTAKAPYCDCAWTNLRKKLQLVDFVGDFKGPRFDDAKKSMVHACKGKLPEAIAKADFMGLCVQDKPDHKPTCECVWKAIRGKYTPEEITANLVSLDKVPAVQKCKPQHPATKSP